jgi:polyribonucleotide nucleotidyltransferase
MKSGKIEIPFGAQNLIIETGKFAKQADGAVIATLGGTSVLAAVCMSPAPRENADFFPLMVEYQEKAYAAGKIPGGFFKREGRPTQKETLTARIIDRPIRPLFPDGLYNDIVVTILVLSSDGENDPDVVAMVAASAALHTSSIPFNGPVGAVRVGLVNGEYILNPTYAQRKESLLELFVVGRENGIVMIEGEGREAPEDAVVRGLHFAEKQFKAQIDLQNQLRRQAGKDKAAVTLFNPHPELKTKISELVYDKLLNIYTTVTGKLERESASKALLNGLLADLPAFDAYREEGQTAVPKGHIAAIFDKVEYDVVRELVFKQSKRADGRGLGDLRDLTSEVAVLPRTHGSGLFTRGQTQSLAVVTLGTRRDEQMVEGLTELAYSNFMLHYNFPSFSVGEARGSRGPGRREIGHGALAAKAIAGVLPTKEEFPYTVRVVSEILESNGSSSMASVCAGCLSLMDAGVPIKSPVAGISIGLMMKEDGDFRLLTDISGLEDHHGDMDYKIAGSSKGITAIQLDLKIQGVPLKVLEEGIVQARAARENILANMTATIGKPRAAISEFAPRIVIIKIPVEKIGEIIGPGGKMIKKIMEITGATSIDIEDDGSVLVASPNDEISQKAKNYIQGFLQVPDVGKIYDGVVTRVMNFGAFVEFLPGREGLVHVSEISNEYLKDINTAVKVGDRFKVKLMEIDQQKRMNLSRKQAEAQSATSGK